MSNVSITIRPSKKGYTVSPLPRVINDIPLDIATKDLLWTVCTHFGLTSWKRATLKFPPVNKKSKVYVVGRKYLDTSLQKYVELCGDGRQIKAILESREIIEKGNSLKISESQNIDLLLRSFSSLQSRVLNSATEMRYDRSKSLVKDLKSLKGTKVLLIGFDGLGVEILKNLLLLGVLHVEVFDENKISWSDVGAGYCFRSEEVGKIKRNDSIVLERMKLLLPSCKCLKGVDSLPKNLSSYEIVVTINRTDTAKISQTLDASKTVHVDVNIKGVVGRYFCSFGGKTYEKFVDSGIDISEFEMTFDDSDSESEDEEEEYNVDHLHICFKALEGFVNKNHRNPYPFNEKDFGEFLGFCKEIVKEKFAKVDLGKKDIARDCKLFCYTLRGQLPPMTTLFGGIVANEILKIRTGVNDSVLSNYIFDYLNMFDENKLPNDTEYDPENLEDEKMKRYISQICVFGKKFQEQILKSKVFVVGAGALGCESLKLLALTGFGKLFLTDMDSIEITNLNRQFLFNDNDVDKMKSSVAKEKILKILGDTEDYGKKIECFTSMIQDLTTFSQSFFLNNKMDIIVTSLDNNDARNYCSDLAVMFDMFLLNSGIQAFTGDTSNHLNGYSRKLKLGRDQPEPLAHVSQLTAFAKCSIMNNPSKTVHLIHFGKITFQSIFEEEMVRLQLGVQVKPINYVQFEIRSIENAIETALYLFNELFNVKVVEKMNQDEKILRTPVLFNVENPIHVNFLCVTFLLLCRCFNLKYDEKEFSGYFSSRNRKSSLKRMKEKPKDVDVTPQRFNKDDPLHISFLVAVANIRKENHFLTRTRITNPIDEQSTKLITIIPTIITTTSVIQGLSMLSYYRYFGQKSWNLEKDKFQMDFYTVNLKPSFLKLLLMQKYDNRQTWIDMAIREEKTGQFTLGDVLEMLKVEEKFKMVTWVPTNEFLFRKKRKEKLTDDEKGVGVGKYYLDYVEMKCQAAKEAKKKKKTESEMKNLQLMSEQTYLLLDFEFDNNVTKTVLFVRKKSEI